MARRVFYFAGFRLKVFEWDGKRLLGSYEFEPNDAGLAQFDQYLTAAAAIPTQLLVDLIEEDFRRELIPHTNARERKILIARLLDRHYRSEKYIHVLPIGRSKEGRRDDVLLFSALTNSELLAPWLNRLQSHKVPLAGIWSLPLLSNRLLSMIDARESNILVLSQQIPTAHRESYFKDGQLMFSRQAKLERDKRDEVPAAIAAQNIMKGSEQIRIFLTNQRIMGFTDKIHVYCILPEDQAEDVRQATQHTPFIDYKFVNLQQLFARYKLSSKIKRETDILFSYLCASAPLSVDHYAQPEHKQFYVRYRFDRIATLSAVLISLVLLVAASFLWLNSIELWQQQQQLDAQRQLLARRYHEDYQPVQLQLDEAGNVQARVDFIKGLEKEANRSPDAFFKPLTVVFNDQRFTALRLNSFSWKKYSPIQLQEVMQQQLANVTEKSAEVSEQPPAEASLDPALQPLVVLEGFLDRQNMSYRDTVMLMEAFTSALTQLPEVTQVVVVRMPVDIRPALTFIDDSGVEREVEDVQKAQADNRYEIMLALRYQPELSDGSAAP